MFVDMQTTTPLCRASPLRSLTDWKMWRVMSCTRSDCKSCADSGAILSSLLRMELMMNRMHSSLSAPLRFSFSVAAGSAGGTFRYGPRQRTKLAGSFAGLQRVTSARQNACKACATTYMSSGHEHMPFLSKATGALKFTTAMLGTSDQLASQGL